MEIDLNKIHSKSGWHEKDILNSKICGCFYCLNIFSPNEIQDWVEEPEDCPRGSGKTALCPNCGIDAVLPDNIEHEITKELLEDLHKEFF
jgi:hypothetical protein